MSEAAKKRHNFKDISLENLGQPDENTIIWTRMTAVAKNPEHWLKFFNDPQCNDKVPQRIVEILEVARGTMIYAVFYHPLATVGAHQCWRVLESGVRERCKQLGIPLTFRRIVKGKEQEFPTSFNHNLNELLDNGHFTQARRDRWDIVRNLRNGASHPETQGLLDPGQAQRQLELAVEFLNELFV